MVGVAGFDIRLANHCICSRFLPFGTALCTQLVYRRSEAAQDAAELDKRRSKWELPCQLLVPARRPSLRESSASG